MQVYLGTVAIEPSRWARHAASPELPASPPINLLAWMDAIAGAGFDGIEAWEPHLLHAPAADRDRIVAHPLPIAVWNSYVSLDEDDPTERDGVAAAASEAGASAIKYNVGNAATQVDAYADRISEWLDLLPNGIRLLCECHQGISVAEDPGVAARIFERAGGADRIQAIVHTHETDEHLRARFDAYGDRIAHVHVNFLDPATKAAPPLAAVHDRLAEVAGLLASFGFDGTWTIEFVQGHVDRRRPPGPPGRPRCRRLDRAATGAR